MAEHNEGIIITGGSFTAEQVATGQNAQAIKTVYTIADELRNTNKEQVAVALEDLLKAIQAHSDSITDEPEVVQAVQQIAEEVKKEKPSKLTLKSLLDGIKQVVEPLTDVVQKVVTLRGAIALLLGVSSL